MPLRLPLAVALTAAALAASPAAACSMVAGYLEPSGLELAAQADTIVIATIVGERREGDEYDRKLVLKPTRLMKGKTVPARVALPSAYLASASEVNGRAARSAPRELRGAHPDAGSGGCVRMLFAPGAQLLVFLKRSADGQFAAMRRPFSRDAEDVSGPNALWVKAVREYAVIARHPRASWPARLRARAAELRALRHPDATAVAADMEAEIGWLSLTRHRAKGGG